MSQKWKAQTQNLASRRVQCSFATDVKRQRLAVAIEFKGVYQTTSARTPNAVLGGDFTKVWVLGAKGAAVGLVTLVFRAAGFVETSS